MRYIFAITIVLLIGSCKNEKHTDDRTKLESSKGINDGVDNNNAYNSDKNFKNFKFNNISYRANKKTQKIGNIYYTATELPLEYYIKKNLKITNLDSLRMLLDDMRNERVIEFEFQEESKKDLLDKEFTMLEYKKSVEYMAFKIKKDFFAITSKNDTISCSGVLFERNYKIAPYKKVLVFFKNIEDKERIKIVYSDVIFGNGIIKFNLKNN